MAGHSKWANIQRRKKAQDARRAKLFSKLSREISVAAREGDNDPAMNSRLRWAIDKALANNMTKENIERALKRAGSGDDANLEEVRYEGYAPGGVAVMVDCLTDNRNRTAGAVRHAFSKFGGNLGENGSVSHMFTRMGVLSYPAGTDEDRLMEVAMEAGADDLAVNDDGSLDVLTTPGNYQPVKKAMSDAGLEPERAEVTERAATSMSLDLDRARTMVQLVDALEDLDDVQNVYSNAEIADETLEQV